MEAAVNLPVLLFCVESGFSLYVSSLAFTPQTCQYEYFFEIESDLYVDKKKVYKEYL